MISKHRLFVLCLALLPLSSYATLGENVNSVNNDYLVVNTSPTKMGLTNNQASSGVEKYLINEQGRQIEEFVANNKVFAIKWSGAGYPNFKQIFGKYAPQLKTGKRVSHSLNDSSIVGNDFVYTSYGLLGHLTGIAYVPSLVPQGFNLNELN